MESISIGDLTNNDRKVNWRVQGNGVELFVLPELAAVDFCPQNDYTVMIRILEPNKKQYVPLKYKDKFKDILQLHFGELATDTRFTNEHAGEVLEFFERHKNAKTFVIHCSAGVSRSPAIAKGLGVFLKDERIIEFIRNNFSPNSLVEKVIQEKINEHLLANVYKVFNGK